MSAVDSTAEEETQVAPAEVVRFTPASLAVTPTVQAAELVARLDVIKQAMQQAMQEGVDYGTIPGAKKPSLWKPGAEKLGVLFQFDVQVATEKSWGPGDHLTVEAHAIVYHAPSGIRMGSGEGMCTTRERKYAVRNAQRACPQCGVEAVIKGKEEYGGGWVCFTKKGGCNAKFRDGDKSIEDQPQGEIDNPDLPDFWNTVIKMAKKRAQIDAILGATGASALFTQDAEDLPRADQPPPAAQAAPEPTAPTDPLATGKQRVAITTAADRSKLTALALVNIIRGAVGLGAVDVPEADAYASMSRILAKLPAKHVAAVLAGIADTEPVEPAAPSDVPWSEDFVPPTDTADPGDDPYASEFAGGAS